MPRSHLPRYTSRVHPSTSPLSTASLNPAFKLTPLTSALPKSHSQSPRPSQVKARRPAQPKLRFGLAARSQDPRSNCGYVNRGLTRSLPHSLAHLPSDTLTHLRLPRRALRGTASQTPTGRVVQRVRPSHITRLAQGSSSRRLPCPRVPSLLPSLSASPAGEKRAVEIHAIRWRLAGRLDAVLLLLLWRNSATWALNSATRDPFEGAAKVRYAARMGAGERAERGAAQRVLARESYMRKARVAWIDRAC